MFFFFVVIVFGNLGGLVCGGFCVCVCVGFVWEMSVLCVCCVHNESLMEKIEEVTLSWSHKQTFIYIVPYRLIVWKIKMSTWSPHVQFWGQQCGQQAKLHS